MQLKRMDPENCPKNKTCWRTISIQKLIKKNLYSGSVICKAGEPESSKPRIIKSKTLHGMTRQQEPRWGKQKLQRFGTCRNEDEDCRNASLLNKELQSLPMSMQLQEIKQQSPAKFELWLFWPLHILTWQSMKNENSCLDFQWQWAQHQNHAEIISNSEPNFKRREIRDAYKIFQQQCICVRKSTHAGSSKAFCFLVRIGLNKSHSWKVQEKKLVETERTCRWG